MLKSLLPKEVKVNITVDNIRLKSSLNNNKTLRFTKISFFNTISGSIESHSGKIGYMPDFVQFIPGKYKGKRPVNFTGIDKIRLKSDCIQVSIVNDFREPFVYSFALDKPPRRKI